MKLRCPACHISASLEAFTADESGRELLALLAQSGSLFRPLVAYVGLFRPATRDLAWDKALRLAKEVMELAGEGVQQAAPLRQALIDTVDAMRAKRDIGQFRPMKNHNYLKQVLATVQPVGAGPCACPGFNDLDQGNHGGGALQKGKRAQALDALVQWGRGDWRREEIAHGLTALIAAGRQGAPAAETVLATAALWEGRIIARHIDVEETDRARLRAGFAALLDDFKDWPEPKDLFPRMPARPRRAALAEPIGPGDRQKAREFFENMGKKL